MSPGRCASTVHHVDGHCLGLSFVDAFAMSTQRFGSPASPDTERHPLFNTPNGLPTDDRDRMARGHYSPPWANTSIIGIAGSSGSGKTSLSHAIIRELNLPWVVILSMDSFYKPLTAEESAAAFRNEYDFDAPEAIDFDNLVERLREIKSGYGYLHALSVALLTVRKSESRHTRLLVREARTPRRYHHHLLTTRADPRGHLRASRRKSAGPARHEDFCGGRRRPLSLTTT